MSTVNYTKLADRNVSFGLIRTNPKLTSNLKISVDSLGDIWFNSIDANESLSNQKYKRVPISPVSNHETNIHRFYDNGKTPTKISFEIGKSIRTDVMARDLKDQYDFELYTSGAKYLSSQYPEKFCYFAPLYLDAVIPEYFIIFRIPGASNYSVGEWSQKLLDPNFTQTQFANDLFKNAKIVKSISLKPDSNIGKYLRRIRRNQMYTPNPLYVNFKDGGYSLYRGISINSGTYVEVPELLGQVLKRSIGQLSLEKYIVGGFERNNIVHSKIINLEFLFSDDTSADYSINRYFGFYCNAIDLAKFDINLDQMYENDSDNPTPLERIYTKYDDAIINLENPNGVVLQGYGVQDDISFIKNSLTDQNSLFFPYIRSKDDTLHFIKSDTGQSDSITFSQNSTSISFAIDDTKFDLGKMFGPNKIFSQEAAQEIFQDTRTTLLLQTSSVPNHLDTIRLYHQNGRSYDPFDKNGKHDDLVFVKDYFSADSDYSIDYFVGNKIEFRIPVDPNLSSAKFNPSLPQLQNVQYISNENGSLWEWTGSAYIESEIVSPINDAVYFYMDGTNDPNNRDQVFIPNIETTSTSTVKIEKSIKSFTVVDVGVFSVSDRIRIEPDSTRYMLGQITQIDTSINQITVNITEIKGGGEYSNWTIRKHSLGTQHVSTATGEIWHTNGKRFNLGSTGTRIYINADGNDTSIIAQRIEKAISALEYSHIAVSRFQNSVFIQSSAFGDTYGSLAILNKSKSSAFLINGSTSFDVIKADGGGMKSQVVIPSGNISKLAPLLDELVVKTHQNWSQLTRVCNSSASVNNGFGPTTQQTVSNFLTKATLKIKDPERILVDYNKIEIRRLFRPSIGVLSMFEIKDIDFDTYSSSYSKIPEIDLYQYYFLPPNVKILDFQKYVYEITGSGAIDVNGRIYTTDDPSQIVWQPRDGLSSFNVVSGDPILIYSNLKPYQFSNQLFNQRARTYADHTYAFDSDYLTPRVNKKDRANLATDLITSLSGYRTSSYTEIDMSTLVENTEIAGQIQLEETYGILFKVGQRVKLTETLTKYIICTISAYDSENGLLTLIFKEGQGSGTLGEYNITRIDDRSLFPEYQLRVADKDEYVTVLLTDLVFNDANPSEQYGTPLLEIVSDFDPTLSQGPWQLFTVTQTETSLRSDIGVLDEDENLRNFSGFFGLGADHSMPNPNTNTYLNRDRYLTNSLKSEYSIYLENFSKEFASTNRVTPYIPKWGIIDSTDSRGNPYRLNSDISFGKDNFGPSHRETVPTAEKLTHEWFYIESSFNYELDPELIRKNYYYFNTPFNVNDFISDPTYFEKYFTFVPKYDNEEIDRPQFRYSKLLRNPFTNQYETVFNGAKFVFSELNERGDILAVTNRFADYNFSILLKPVKEDLLNPQKPINFRIIENTDAKSIIVLIEVALSGKDRIGSDLLLNSDDLPGAVLAQSNMFSKLYIKEPTVIYPKVDVIYTVPSGSIGNSEFFRLTSNNPTIYKASPLLGTAIDTQTGLEIANFSISPGKTILIKRNDDSEYAVLAMPGTQIFNLSLQGKLVDFCLAQEVTPSGPVEVAYTVSNLKRIVVGNDIYNPLLIFKEIGPIGNGVKAQLTIDSLNRLPIQLAQPTWKSTFGDFRLEFNENDISNLSYAFLYAVKDKKFNKVKSSFSTVKLAKGISLSASQFSGDGSEQQRVASTSTGDFSLQARTLKGMPDRAFTLNSFINPISGPVTQTKSFAPIMVIDSFGKASIIINVSADLVQSSTAESIESLQDPALTDHSIKSVSPNELILSTTTSPKNILAKAYTVSAGPSGPIETPINTSTTDYANTTILVKFGSIDSLDSYDIGNDVRIVNGDTFDSPKYLLGKITGRAAGPSGELNPYAEVSIYYQNGLFAYSNGSWRITRPQGIQCVSLQVKPNNATPELRIDSSSFPVTFTTDDFWTQYNQQFQLFGGKGYFSNLFENLSFANFIKLIEGETEILSWETYTNGQRILRPRFNNKLFSIQIEDADQIKKATIVKPVEQVVETGSRIQAGGYEPSEVQSEAYEVFRYSGEYEILFKPVAGFKYRDSISPFKLDGANINLNTNVSNFFVLPEFSYVKFSKKNILDLESANKFSPNYPLIGESPLDYSKFNILSSSWDFNYHYEYSTKKDKTAIPGSNRIVEDYSFLSKLINMPTELTIEPTIFQLVTNKQFEISDSDFAATDSDVVYSIYEDEVRLKINFSKVLAKNLLNNGLNQQFNDFFKDENSEIIENNPSLIGNLSLTQYKIKYCELNLNKLFKIDQFECFAKPDYTVQDNAISFSNIEYGDLQNLGYSQINTVQINNPNSSVLVFTIAKNPSTGVNLVPKLKIKYI